MATTAVTTWLYAVVAAVALMIGDGGARAAAALLLAYLAGRGLAKRTARTTSRLATVAAVATGRVPVEARP